ncbi:MAG: citrate/2-methylcitrate synthase [Variovorax sp.]
MNHPPPPASPGSRPAASHPADLIDAHTAMATLGVKAQTLYAYVSRGLIRSINPDRRKASLYHREDIEALQMRGRTRRATDNAAQRALRVGGGAVMHSAITQIGELGPSYRGQLATDLALNGLVFEQCAELLWSGLLPTASTWQVPDVPPVFPEFVRVVRRNVGGGTQRLLALLVEAWASCLGSDAEMAASVPIIAARNVIHVMTGAIGLLRPTPAFAWCGRGQSIAQGLARSLGVAASEENLRWLNAALVLCADHELAPATFAARIAASNGADIHACISSALGASEGFSTGLGCNLAEHLLRSARTPKGYVATLAREARQKQSLAGYNHSLYPRGDPRALTLMALIADSRKLGAQGALALRCIQAAREQLGAEPGLGIGLAALAIAGGHPPRTPAALMSLGRCAGWIAHIYEQRMAGFLVRPRAKYVGL